MFVLVHLERAKPQNFQWRRAIRSKIKGHTFYRLLSGTLIYSAIPYVSLEMANFSMMEFLDSLKCGWFRFFKGCLFVDIYFFFCVYCLYALDVPLFLGTFY